MFFLINIYFLFYTNMREKAPYTADCAVFDLDLANCDETTAPRKDRFSVWQVVK